MPVFVGMRNWKPFIGDTVKAIASQGFERVIAICLAPQNSRTSVGLYRSAVIGDGNLPFEMDFVEQWHDHPLLIKAFAEKLRSGWEKASAENGAKLPVIFTAHSVPERTITEGDPYEKQSKETARLVAQEAGLEADQMPTTGLSPSKVRACQAAQSQPMDRPYGRGNDQQFKSKRPSRRLRASHRISVRSRGSALRYRHRLQTIRGKRRHAPVASRVVERLEDVNGSPGGNSKQPRLALALSS